MKLLEPEYTVKGQKDYIYSVVERDEQVCIAKQLNKETREFIAFEVFEVMRYPDRWSPDGKVFIPAKETPPSAEMWGLRGFTVHTIEQARERFNQIKKRLNGN